jgi:hypothetical protein
VGSGSSGGGGDSEVTIAMIVPSYDMVHMDFAVCSWALMAKHGKDIFFINPRTSVIQISRYEAVQKCLARGVDQIFFVDSDLTFPSNALERLLAHDVPIVAATYMQRRTPEVVLGVPFEDISPSKTGLYKFFRMPIGFSLIKAEVFDAIEPPWFPVTWDPVLQEHTSEDYNFCYSVRKAGYDLMVDLDLSHELGHIGTRTFRWARKEEGTKSE